MKNAPVKNRFVFPYNLKRNLVTKNGNYLLPTVQAYL